MQDSQARTFKFGRAGCWGPWLMCRADSGSPPDARRSAKSAVIIGRAPAHGVTSQPGRAELRAIQRTPGDERQQLRVAAAHNAKLDDGQGSQ